MHVCGCVHYHYCLTFYNMNMLCCAYIYCVLRILRTTSPQPPLSIFSYIYIYKYLLNLLLLGLLFIFLILVAPCFKKSFKIRSWVPSPQMP